MGSTENLSDVIRQVVLNRQTELMTALPAEIVSYDFRTQKASVKPVINRKFADGKIQPYPIINNVPVIFTRSGGASMTFPVKTGDTVLLVFMARSIDTWVTNGGTVDQDDNRLHDLNDAVAIPGLISFATGSKAKNNDDVYLTYAGSEVIIRSNGEIIVQSPISVTIDTPETIMTGNATINGNIQVDGNGNVDGNMGVGGDLAVGGDVDLGGDLRDIGNASGSLDSFRAIYNFHTHPENDNGGPTDDPNQKV